MFGGVYAVSVATTVLVSWESAHPEPHRGLKARSRLRQYVLLRCPLDILHNSIREHILPPAYLSTPSTPHQNARRCLTRLNSPKSRSPCHIILAPSFTTGDDVPSSTAPTTVTTSRATTRPARKSAPQVQRHRSPPPAPRLLRPLAPSALPPRRRSQPTNRRLRHRTGRQDGLQRECDERAGVKRIFWATKKGAHPTASRQ